MKILFLSRWFPFPADNGSKIRIHNLLRGLSQQHDVTLLSFYDPQEMSPEDIQKYPYCSRMQVVPWKPFNRKSREATFGLFRSTPRSLLDTHSPQMETLIRDVISSEKIDLVIASQLTMASYYPAFAGIPAIFEEIELGLYVGQSRQNWIHRIRRQLTWFKLKKYFLRLIDSFVACTVVSEQERQIFASAFPMYSQKAVVLPNCLNMDEYPQAKSSAEPCKLIFSGSFRYHPNYHAIQWFLTEVYPLILRKKPDVNLTITGDRANLPLPDIENVTLAGYVDDIKTLITSCRVSIAPLWSGGGTRLKILEAMALGTPVVATSKGAEGLAAQHGEHILIADDPGAFAESVIELLNNEDLHNKLSSNARQLVKDQYDWSTMLPKFLDLIEKAVVG